MKKILVSAAFAVMLASPAFAQAYSPGYGTGNLVTSPAIGGSAPVSFSSAGSAYASAPRTNERLRGVRAEALSANDPDTVYVNGQYVGRDPDPNVRLELRKDWMHE